MPLQIIRERRPREDEALANAILLGTQGFIEGRRLREAGERKRLSDIYALSRLYKLRREEEALREPVPPGYLRLPGGRIVPSQRQSFSRQTSPGLIAQIGSGRTSSGKALDPAYRAVLAGTLGFTPKRVRLEPARQGSKFLGIPYGRKPAVMGTQYIPPPNINLPAAPPGQQPQFVNIPRQEDEDSTSDQDLIEEYQTTDDPARASELEEILTRRGHVFQ